MKKSRTLSDSPEPRCDWQRRLLAAFAFSMIALNVGPAFASGDIRTVALLHSPLYTAADGETFAALYLPSIDAAGGAAFRTDTGVYSEDANRQLGELARVGENVGGSTAIFDAFSGVDVNAAGRVALLARVKEPGITTSSRDGIWAENDAGGLSPIVQAGDPALGVGEGVFFPRFVDDDGPYFGLPLPRFSFGAQGQIAFRTMLVGPGAIGANDRGVFTGTLDGLTLVARRGSPAPGAGDAVFSIFPGPMPPAVNAYGQTAFLATIEGPDASAENTSGIWIDTPGRGLAIAARTGDVAPGTEAGVKWSVINRLSLNDAGQVAFSGYLTGSGVGSGNNAGIWFGDPGHASLVARGGMPAPGTGGAVFQDFQGLFNPSMVTNRRGEVAFFAQLTGSDVHNGNDTGLWSREPSGVLSLLAREGDAAPGGGTFSAFDDFGTALSLNGQGQAALLAQVITPGDPPTAKDAIWAQDRNRQLQLIVQEGQRLEVADGSTSGSRSFEIQYLSFADGSHESGLGTGFNDRGEIAFWARSTHSGPGLFVSTRVAIPEPTASGLLLTVLLVVVVAGFGRGFPR